MKLSYSKIRTWTTCQRQWQFKYVENIQPRDVSRALKFGSLFHKLLSYHYGVPSDHPNADPLARFAEDAQRDPMYHDDADVQALYAMVENNFIEYFHHWHEDEADWHIYKVEEHFEVPFKIGRKFHTFQGYFDLVIENKRGMWLVEHKTGKTDFPTDLRLWDLQSMVYHYAFQKLFPTDKLSGTLWNYITSSPIIMPEVLRSGNLSTRKTMRTTWRLYEQQIEEMGLNVDDYAHMKRHLEGKMSNYFNRTYLPDDRDIRNRILSDLTAHAANMIRHASRPDALYPRSLGRHCSWCQYSPLCHIDLLTGEYEDDLEPDYFKETENQKENRLKAR